MAGEATFRSSDMDVARVRTWRDEDGQAEAWECEDDQREASSL
jgi:hypothetical protein